eukprot:jgi/Chlat1/2035/Chrsp159S02331
MLRLFRQQEGAAAAGGSGVPELVRLSDHGNSVSIGRNPSCQLRLSSATAPALLSRKHAVVKRRHEGQFVLEDQQSFNGCFVNNGRVSSPTVLNHGDIVSFGPQVLINTEGGEFCNPFIYRFEADASDQLVRRESSPEDAAELASASGHRIQRPGKATVDARGNSSSCRAVDLVVDLTDDAEVLGPEAASTRTVDLTAEPPAVPHAAQPGPSSAWRERHARPGLQQATLLDLDKAAASRRKRNRAEEDLTLSSPKRPRQQDATVPASATEPRKEDTTNTAMELLGEEFECVICREWLIAAHTLSCSHTFCGDCITPWLNKNDTCPTCRERVTGPPVAVRTIDNVIDRMASHMTDAERAERERRKKVFEQMKKRQSPRSRHHHPRMGTEIPFGHYPSHVIHMSDLRAPSPSHVLRMLQHLPLGLFPPSERQHAVPPPRVQRRPQSAGGAGSSRRCTYSVEYARNGRFPCHTCHAHILTRQPYFTVAPEGHPPTHHHIHCLQLRGGVSLRSINGLRNLSVSDQARVREAVELIV